MIASRLALAFALAVAVAVPASAGGGKGGSGKGGGGKGSSGGSSKYACRSGDTHMTCDTDYEVFDVGSAASHDDRSAACALVGEGWGLCTLQQLCPFNPNATATRPTLPATQLFYSSSAVSGGENKDAPSVTGGVSVFSDEQWVAISSPSGSSCASGAWAQLGTRSALADLCKTSSQVDYCPDPAGEDGKTASAICCGCASSRARESPAVKHCPGTDAPTKSPPVDVDPGPATKSDMMPSTSEESSTYQHC